MTGRKAEQPPISCAECRASLQDYLDGTMVKTESMRVFLHLRDCADCEAVHRQWQATFEALESMPELEPPADFDARVLAAVPYDSYRAMAELRAPRVPVIFAEESLPAVVRSPVTRLAGMVVAAGAGVAMGWFDGPSSLAYLVLAGLLPEAVVRLQGALRGAVLVLQRDRGRA